MAKPAASAPKIKRARTRHVPGGYPKSLTVSLSSYPLNYLVEIGMGEAPEKPMLCIYESLYTFAYGEGFMMFWMENIGPLLYYLAMGEAARALIDIKVLYGVTLPNQRATVKTPLLLSIFYQALFEVARMDPDPVTSKVICAGLEEALEEHRQLVKRRENGSMVLGNLEAFQKPLAAWREYIERDTYDHSTVRSIRNKFKVATASYSVPIQTLNNVVKSLNLTDEDNAGRLLDTTLLRVDRDGSVSMYIPYVPEVKAAPPVQSPQERPQIKLQMPKSTPQNTREALSLIWGKGSGGSPAPTSLSAFVEFCDKQPPSVFIDALRLWSKVTFPFAGRLMMVPDALYLLEIIYTPDEFTRVTGIVDSYYLVEWANMYVHFLKMSKGEGLSVEDCEAGRLRAVCLLSTQVMYGLDCENPDTLTKVQDIYKRAGLEAELDILEGIYHDYPTMRGRVVNSNPDAKFKPAPSTH